MVVNSVKLCVTGAVARAEATTVSKERATFGRSALRVFAAATANRRARKWANNTTRPSSMLVFILEATALSAVSEDEAAAANPSDISLNSPRVWFIAVAKAGEVRTSKLQSEELRAEDMFCAPSFDTACGTWYWSSLRGGTCSPSSCRHT